MRRKRENGRGGGGAPSDLHVKDAGDPDGAADPFQTQRGHLGVVAILQPHAEGGQQGSPRQLQHTQTLISLSQLAFYLLSANGCDPVPTLNMGLTCSRCVALKKGAWAWLTASISALAVLAICSISMLYSRRRCFSLATSGKEEVTGSCYQSHALVIAAAHSK